MNKLLYLFIASTDYNWLSEIQMQLGIYFYLLTT